MLTFADRAQIAAGIKLGLSDAAIGELVDRDRSAIWRERWRNSTLTCGYRPVSADVKAEKRRARPQTRRIDADLVLRARVVKDLSRSRTPRQVGGQLRLEARNPNVGIMPNSLPVEGACVSQEAIYRWIYALPKGELARQAIMLRSERRARKQRRPLGERTAGRIIGMISVDGRDPDATRRRVPGRWEGDLIIGRGGASAAGTLVERTTRFVTILALLESERSDALADVLSKHIHGMLRLVSGSLTWDQRSEMARHVALTLATRLPVYFADPHSPWQRPTTEDTNSLLHEYLPKGSDITDRQTYLNAIGDELHDPRRRGRLPHPQRRLPAPARRLTERSRRYHNVTPPPREIMDCNDMSNFISYASAELLALYLVTVVTLLAYFVWKYIARRYLLSPFTITLLVFAFAVLVTGPAQFTDQAWAALGTSGIDSFAAPLREVMIISLAGLLLTTITLWMTEARGRQHQASAAQAFGRDTENAGRRLSIAPVAMVARISVIVFVAFMLSERGIPLLAGRDLFIDHGVMGAAYKIVVGCIQLTTGTLLVYSMTRRSTRFVPLLILGSLALLATGSRAGIASIAQILVAVAIYTKGPARVARRTFLASIALVIVAFGGLFLSFFRTDAGFTFAAAWRDLVYGNTFSDMRDGAFVLRGWETRFAGAPLGGRTYAAALLSFLPSSYSAFRQEWSWGYFSTSTLFGWSDHFGLRGGWYLESFINFGWAGVLCSAIAIGVILGEVERRFFRGAVCEHDPEYWRIFLWSQAAMALLSSIAVSNGTAGLISTLVAISIIYILGLTHRGLSDRLRPVSPQASPRRSMQRIRQVEQS